MAQAKVSIFDQFGFEKYGESGDQYMGRCPFCGDPKHFFWNHVAPNKTWDCKKCGRSGGFTTFLTEMAEFCSDNFTTVTSRPLIKDRGLAYSTFKRFHVGFHPLTRQYTIPVYGYDKNSVLNIKLYDFKAFRNAAGCTSAMFNLPAIGSEALPHNQIWICEGEWDAMALDEVFYQAEIHRAAIIAVPGAGTFKADVLPKFTGRTAFLAFDNDDAGRNGAKKAGTLLSQVTREVYKVVWPDGTDSGYDIRDLYQAHGRKAQAVWDYLSSVVARFESEGATTSAGGTNGGVEANWTEVPPNPQDIYDVFQKWLYIPDKTLLDVVYGAVLANRIPGDPVWLLVVAPPGGTKSEPLMAMTDAPGIFALSSMTSSSLISGSNVGGEDPSLIHQLNGSVLVIKDFTTILDMNEQTRKEIMSTLRDAYDQEAKRTYGNGIVREFKSKFGVIAAVTPVVELYTEEMASMGERFLRWRNFIPKSVAIRRKYIDAAVGNIGKEPEMKAELKEMAHRIIRSNYSRLPEVSEDFRDEVANIAELVSRCRATVHRDKYTKEIVHRSDPELGTRLSKQLSKLALGVGMFQLKDDIDEDVRRVIRSVAISTIPVNVLDVLKLGWEIGLSSKLTPAVVSSRVHLPVSTTTRALDGMVAIGMLEQDNANGEIGYIFREESAKLVVDSKIFN